MAAGDRLTPDNKHAEGVAPLIFTIGHSTRTSDALISLLRDVAAERLVDVRSFPRSRVNPQFNIEALPADLAAAGIGYLHVRALGGRRGRQTLPVPSPNTYWRNPGFRNFADYALGAEFHAARDALLQLAQTHVCVLMCAEAAWQRCHRQIIADWLVASGATVRHILGPGRSEAARLHPAAVVQENADVHYPSPQGSLLE